MKIILKSDFIDYYDHWFDSESLIKPDEKYAVLNRRTNSGPTRPTMFNMFWANGIFVPGNGIIKSELANWASCQGEVVVYTDISSHCGENKIKMSIQQALEEYPDCYYSAYIKDKIPGRSLRYLKIGSRAWELEYVSKDDWRSNVGDVDIKILREVPAATSFKGMNFPIFAIDYAIDGHDNLKYGIDFNIAPGLKYTGLENILPGKEVYSLIKEWYETHDPILTTNW